MPVFMSGTMCNDTVYNAAVSNGRHLCRRTDGAAGERTFFFGAYPAGGSGRRFILGGWHAGRI